MLFGEPIILPVGNGGGGAKESEYEVPLVPEYDLAVDGLEDEKLLLRSLRNMAVSFVSWYGSGVLIRSSIRVAGSCDRSSLPI